MKTKLFLSYGRRDAAGFSQRLLTGWRYDQVNSDEKKNRLQINPWSGLDKPPQAVIDKATAKGKEVNEKIKDERIVKSVIGLMKSGRLKVHLKKPSSQEVNKIREQELTGL